MTAPLTSLMMKEPFLWSTEAQLAFNKIKEALSSALVLSLPDFTLPFTVETDPSGTGMGVVFILERPPHRFL